MVGVDDDSSYKRCSICRNKLVEAKRRWILANPEFYRTSIKRDNAAKKEKGYSHKYYTINKDRLKMLAKNWSNDNPEKRSQYYKNWKKNNRPYLSNRDSLRRAAKKNAQVSWANSKAIMEIYEIAELCQETLGYEFQVDHIVPLQSIKVCGLHCEANLRVITKRENLIKGNRVWPDMWSD